MYGYEEKIGDYRALCQRCGFKYWASEMSKEWNGLYVCKKCWEPRHPMDFQRAKKEDTSVPWTSPDDTEAVLQITDVTADDTTYTHVAGNVNAYYRYPTFLVTWHTIVPLGDTPEDGDQFIVEVIERPTGKGLVISGIDGGSILVQEGNVTYTFRGDRGKWVIESKQKGTL